MTLSNTVFGLVSPSLLIWLYLLLGRHGCWRARPRLELERWPVQCAWPDVVAVIPARNEARTVETTLRSLLGQDYGGALTIVLVDDHSQDGTRSIAERLAVVAARHLDVVEAPALPAGWSGKLWAVASGLRRAEELAPAAPYVLLTDADIPPGQPRAPRRQGRGGPARSGLADGPAPLRELLGAAPDPTLRLLLPEAVPVSRGQRSGLAGGSGRRRLHVGPAAGVACGRRDRGDSRRADRRRGARPGDQAAAGSGSGSARQLAASGAARRSAMSGRW
jgi:Glycosyl transferase family 2